MSHYYRPLPNIQQRDQQGTPYHLEGYGSVRKTVWCTRWECPLCLAKCVHICVRSLLLQLVPGLGRDSLSGTELLLVCLARQVVVRPFVAEFWVVVVNSGEVVQVVEWLREAALVHTAHQVNATVLQHIVCPDKL